MVNQHGRSLYSIVRNLPIQYFATGELASVSTLCLLYEARRRQLRYECVMLIHDDTSGEVHAEDAEAFHAVCRVSYGEQTHSFLRSVYGINYDVELAAESKVGPRFGEGKQQKHTYSFPHTDEDLLAMKVAAKTTSNRPPDVKAGTHIVLVNALVDLGTQPGSEKYPSPKRKVYVGFEFPNVMVEFKEDNGSTTRRPARLGRFMALSMHEKASFRKMVESLRGKKFANDAEASNFELREILGMPGMGPVSHKTVDGTTYANIGDPVPLIEGMSFNGQLSSAPLYFDTDNWDADAFKLLPEFLQNIINQRIVPQGGGSKGPAPISGGLPDLGTDNGGDGKISF